MAGEREETREESEGGPEAREEALREKVSFNWSGFARLLDDALAQAALVPPDLADLPWVPMGPRNVGGRIRALAADPRNPATIYAGSAFGGLWRTRDAGDTWDPLEDFRPAGDPDPRRIALPIGAVAVAPSDPGTIYVGTGEPVVAPGLRDPEAFVPGNGLYLSTDGGAHFEQLDHPETGTIAAHRFERIAVDPWTPGRCWIACPKGLFRREPGRGLVRELIAPVAAPTAGGSLDASDVVLAAGLPSSPPLPRFVVYAALRGQGVYRRTFDRGSGSYVEAAWEALTEGLPESGMQRIKLALCRAQPSHLYLVHSDAQKHASWVYRSRDGGLHWQRTERRGDDGKDVQAHYNLVLEVHPENPQIAFVGAVDLFRTLNGGEGWARVLDADRYDAGARAYHADQHALLFDEADPRRIWLANDGGVSMSNNLGELWRKRSHGILCAQVNELAVHPRYPFLQAIGMQDNGTWLGLGGPSWLYVDGGDGGAAAFDPTRPGDRLLATWQSGLALVTLETSEAAGAFNLSNPVPDDPSLGIVWAASRTRTQGFDAQHGPPPIGVVEHHPSRADHALVGRSRAGYLTTDGVNFRRLATGDFSPPEAFVTALAYAPTAPDDEWWLGTSRGEVFVTVNGSAAVETWASRHLPVVARRRISQVAVHPASADIVAVALAGSPAVVLLSGDKGRNWWDVSGNGLGPLRSPDADALRDVPVLAIAFDPESPPGVGALQTLYAGTLAGVYVVRNAMPSTTVLPPAATPAPVWRTFDRNLPLCLVTDLAVVVERDTTAGPPVPVVRRALRCATYGRGIFECDLAGTPATRLYIRDSIVDDGFIHRGDAFLDLDPRQAAGGPFDRRNGVDVRVAGAPFSFFEETIDGVDFDEDLEVDLPRAGELNRVYVQVHNGGRERATAVEVHLFQAVGSPPSLPNLQADFWTAFPVPAGSAPWSPVAPARIVDVAPGQPRVVTFEWTLPVTAPRDAALLAFCRLPGEALPTARLTDVLVNREPRIGTRRARVRAFVPDVFVRDGVDDAGVPGAVAWGGRSPDLIVVQAPEAAPNTAFADLGAARPTDLVRGAVANHLYVRLHNRRDVPLEATVEVFHMPLALLASPASWTSLGRLGPVPVPARSWNFPPPLTWTPADPEPSAPAAGKSYALLAVVSRPGDDAPDFSGVHDLGGLWAALREGERSNNAALRVLAFQP
jgi:photosystem II stability/assembly factor-like uncharacterized protein